jgi:hypothetical protein
MRTYDNGTIRQFDTGATRDTSTDKLDFEAFLSPLVLERYAEYMHRHRLQPDGTLRDGDNWQKGIPRDVYMKSLWRHFFDLWKAHRRLPTKDSLTEILCAVLFNAMGYLHELQVGRDAGKPEQPSLFDGLGAFAAGHGARYGRGMG